MIIENGIFFVRFETFVDILRFFVIIVIYLYDDYVINEPWFVK